MNEDSDGLKSFESELFAALSRVDEIDLNSAQKREILRRASMPPRAARRAVRAGAIALAACAVCMFVLNLRDADENFSLDDIIISGEARTGQQAPRAEVFWRKAVEADGDLRVQEEYALACVYGDFEGDDNPGGPLRKVECIEVRAVMVFVK